MSLDASSNSTLPTRTGQPEPELKGWLYKWTNYLKGYQKRWFVLSNGLLSYYRNPMEISQSCRGAISLVSAVIHTEDSCNFVVANGGTQTYHLRASSEVERQKWVTALELAKVRAIRQMDAEEDDIYDLAHDKSELQSILKSLQAKLEQLTTCNDVVMKHGNTLQRSLTELEQIENPSEAISKSKAINERATLYRITSSAMINASVEYLNCAQTHCKKLQKLLHHEHESRLKLEECLEQLAKQHSQLEQRAIKVQQQTSEQGTFSQNDNTEEDEFYDAEENNTAEFVVTFPGKAHRIHSSSTPTVIAVTKANSQSSESTVTFEDSNGKSDDQRKKRRLRRRKRKESNSINDSGNSNDEEVDVDEDDVYSGSEEDIEVDVVTRKSIASTVDDTDNKSTKTNNVSKVDSAEGDKVPANGTVKCSARKRRTIIPIRPNHSLNLWSIMKNCIGKELTKIPMPVNFNEPLSMLQRMTEEFEYAHLLHKAATITDPLEQLVYVAVFSVTCYATTSNRTNKPFNPLLGETYECDRRDDLGWRCISEQVSHHPPMLAQHCEGKDWVCWREFAMTSKFRGKYLSVNPIDITHLEFSNGAHYTWRKVTTTVHNIIVGKLWVDNHGEMKITNHTTNQTCHLTFHPYSFFSRDVPKKVTGAVVDQSGDIKWVLQGTWDNKMEAAKVLSSSQKVVKGAASKPLVETGTLKQIWKRVLPPNEYEKMYNMTLLAVQLNEPEEGVAPTDSRLRPDQRLMEQASWDEANELKAKLEDRQRLTQRIREEEAERAIQTGSKFIPYAPAWFARSKDPVTGNPVHMVRGGGAHGPVEYWDCKERHDWERCPNIYLD